ncbi:thiamine pyrophosphate-binding protein, partial [Romboutsia sp.]|uniref:thiamine pyrophosphate-binding protein n=1 Tax=Romboutsia sp. TaxID=1965302 RepID=UPI002BBAD16F
MNGAKILLECLKKEGVDTLFGYPGGAVIPLYDALYDYQKDFTHIRTSHEQGLVHAADGYARSTGKVGVCITTSGPGATNAITGIATAYMDSIPLVVITGQVPTSLLGRDSFQEIDITGVTLSITKHNYLVRKVEDIPSTIKNAFKVANTGRKGPVLIDIPKDIFTTEMNFDILNYESYKNKNKNKCNYNDTKKIEEAVNMIKSSSKPVIYAG